MSYYPNRGMTTDELISAELGRETSGSGLGDGSNTGAHHGQGMVLGSSGAGDLGRAPTDDQHQHQHMLQFTPSQQVGVDPNHDLSYGEQSARKRSKISRACDECRRKKVCLNLTRNLDASIPISNIAIFSNNRSGAMQAPKTASRHAPTVVAWVWCVNSVACL